MRFSYAISLNKTKKNGEYFFFTNKTINLASYLCRLNSSNKLCVAFYFKRLCKRLNKYNGKISLIRKRAKNIYKSKHYSYGFHRES